MAQLASLFLVGWLSGQLLSLEICVERSSEQEGASKDWSWLVVGSLHDDKLLLGERLSLQTFQSPYVAKLSTSTSAKGEATPEKTSINEYG